MANSPRFIAFIRDELAPLGAITVRNMFGGTAIYCDGQVFALVTGDVLHFKADDQTRPSFEQERCVPFSYATKDGTHHLTSYWRAPERLLDETEDLIGWARLAIAAAHRAAKARKQPKVRPAPKSKSADKTKAAKRARQ
jgi:DNA transformation protein and related proteins